VVAEVSLGPYRGLEKHIDNLTRLAIDYLLQQRLSKTG
jgi:hypothetical protein